MTGRFLSGLPASHPPITSKHAHLSGTVLINVCSSSFYSPVCHSLADKFLHLSRRMNGNHIENSKKEVCWRFFIIFEMPGV